MSRPLPLPKLELIACRPYKARITATACEANRAMAVDPRKAAGLNRILCLTCERMPAAAARKAKKARKATAMCGACNEPKPYYAKGLCRGCYHWELAQKRKERKTA